MISYSLQPKMISLGHPAAAKIVLAITVKMRKSGRDAASELLSGGGLVAFIGQNMKSFRACGGAVGNQDKAEVFPGLGAVGLAHQRDAQPFGSDKQRQLQPGSCPESEGTGRRLSLSQTGQPSS